ncbi:CXXC motif containing zinc binding protein [Aspergillus melleus]|uniref:CXXC motif containing zinc binding protein n=1 Tax=Aspergillus melleus TaxID=138277 RepID=UPI001E8CDCB7|nr:uncharacterized protein LDX57_007302 [Aspergillus melleus]KAH8429630.1 hypothetical protein LDX57_007302 [Aspergillus melleus]
MTNDIIAQIIPPRTPSEDFLLQTIHGLLRTTVQTIKMLSLILTAELNGVTELRPTDTEDNPYYYTFKVQCNACRETHPNWVSFTRFEQHEIPGSRGEANFVWKCKLCQVGLKSKLRNMAYCSLLWL